MYRLMISAVDRLGLDLRGLTVLTEAATGPYVVTPVLAAMAGADVRALAVRTPYASGAEIQKTTETLADVAHVGSRIRFIYNKESRHVAEADILTNTGPVRPIDARVISSMKATAVISLMYESWEYRPSDVDLAACRARGIAVAGTNERHPAVDVFSFLGPMAVRQLQDAGVAVWGSRLLVLCDNSFSSYILRGLVAAGAEVVSAEVLSADVLADGCDAVLVALQPAGRARISTQEARLLRDLGPGAVLVQFWGDVDRVALAAFGIPMWPSESPLPGHMGVLPSDLGPEPIVRLQAGGSKVGELLSRGSREAASDYLDLVQLL